MNLAEMRRDIILFKDETLKLIREMGKQLFEGLKQKSFELDSKLSEIESKLSKYKEINKRMYDTILEQKVYIEKIKNLTDFKSKTETRLLSFDIKLSNFFSELVSFKSRYDKIIIDNLTIPGVIGVSCKYNTIADYIADNLNKAKLFHNEQEKIKNEINFLLKNNEKFEKSLNGAVDVAVNTSKLYVDARNNEIRDFIKKNIENINNVLFITKNDIEENVFKKDDVKDLIKNEIDNTHKEIMNIIDQHKKIKDNKEKDKDKKNNDKLENASEIKKELKEIKKSFKDLKTNMENQMMNAMKLIKEKENLTSSKNINNHLLLKSTEIKNNHTVNQENNIINTSNNNETYYRTLQNNETRYNININKEKNTDNNNNYIKETSNFKISEQPNNKNNKIKSVEKALGLKSSKENNNKLKGILLNPIYLNTEKNEHNIIETEDSLIKGKGIYSPNKDITKNNNSRNVNRYKTFSETKYNFHKKYFQEGNIEDNKLQNKIYLNTNIAEIRKQEKKKYVIQSINSNNLKDIKSPSKENKSNENPNTFSSEERNSLFKKGFKGENSDSDNNNIAIKLMKNKKKMIDDFNLNYIKQYYPTLNLYKNYFNKKMGENKGKENLKDKIIIPKKISPAFGRTAYTEFVKPNNNINLKKYNGNVNIVIGGNIRNLIQERKYFYTLNNEKIRCRSFNKDKNKKKMKKEENEKNLSV